MSPGELVFGLLLNKNVSRITNKAPVTIPVRQAPSKTNVFESNYVNGV